MNTQSAIASASRPQPDSPGRSIDPITLEVVRYKLEGIANEMQSTLLRSSFSSIVKEGMDASSSLFSVKGEILAQALAVPGHMTMLIPMVARLLEDFPLASLVEGDVLIMNDPYMGGTHTPDIALVAPVFSGGAIVALAATLTHHQDVGGMTPGSLPTNATEILHEGLRIPPLKFRSAGAPNETLLAVLRRNVREPHSLVGDLNAQYAACQIGARRLSELADNYGSTVLTEFFEALLNHSERLTRNRLREIPDGTYRYTDYLDNDGIDIETPVVVNVTVIVRDGTFHVDFTGSSAQVKGPFNAVESGALSAACFAVRALTGGDIPTNAGCYRPVSIFRPDGSLFSPREPAPVGARSATIKRAAASILAAFKDVLSDRIPADPAGVLVGVSYGGRSPSTGSTFVGVDLIVGGTGASASADGVDVIETDVTNCMNTPVEAIEMDAPFRIHKIELCRDSGGPGRFRGGLGLVKEFEFLGDEAVVTYRGERHNFAARGNLGGKSGAFAKAEIRRADGSLEIIPSKGVIRLRQGDHLVVTTPGGGGYGDPLMRDQSSVAKDLRDGLISDAEAHETYGLRKVATTQARRRR